MSQQSSPRNRRIDAAQSFCVLVGVTLGIVPLVQRATGHQQGWTFRLLFGQPPDPWAYVLPLLVMVAVVGAIAAAEFIKTKN